MTSEDIKHQLIIICQVMKRDQLICSVLASMLTSLRQMRDQLICSLLASVLTSLRQKRDQLIFKLLASK